MTVALTVGNRPGDIIRTACARGTPMNAPAPTAERLSTSRCRPMPGSIITGTAPVRSNANVMANSSNDGLTIRMVRTPLPMPILWNAWARRSAV